MSLTSEQIEDLARQVYESKIQIVDIAFSDLNEESKQDYRDQAVLLWSQGAWG